MKRTVKLSLLLLRIFIGWNFFFEGLMKLFLPEWSSMSYLKGSYGFLSGFYHWMASDPNLVQVIDFVNIWGMILMVNSSYLYTKETYGDFVLELDFKVPDEPIYGMIRFNGKGKPGNSGVFIRVEDKANPVHTGIEIQVGTAKPGATLGRGSVGGIYDLVPPVANVYKPGEWNHYRITCKGSLVTVELNGVETASADLNDWVTERMNPDGSKNKFKRPLKDFARTGYVGLQDHGTPAVYRNIRYSPIPIELNFASFSSEK